MLSDGWPKEERGLNQITLVTLAPSPYLLALAKERRMEGGEGEGQVQTEGDKETK